jgi:hypothetical protein
MKINFKINFQSLSIFLEHSKALSICGIFLLIFLSSCNAPLGVPGNPVAQIEQAIDGQKKAMSKMNNSNKKELIAKKREVSSLLDKAEPFLSRRANELEKTELLLTQGHLRKSQDALRLYLDERTKEGKDTTTNEISRAMSQASEFISKAEEEFNRFKSKQPDSDD